MDVTNIEKVEADLNAFIERRAQGSAKAQAEEMSWKQSVRKYHARLDKERLREQHAYHSAMIAAHTQNFERLLRRHRVGLRLAEEALGIVGDAERKTA